MGVLRLNSTGHSFEKKLVVGKIAEDIVEGFLKPIFDKIDNVTKVKSYQNDDIDFLGEKEGEKITIEVKGDGITETSRNFFYETISNIKAGTLGCLEKTKADVLAYVIFSEYKDTQILFLNIKYFREWFHEHEEKFILKEIQNQGENGREPYKSNGRLVPIFIKKGKEDVPTIMRDIPEKYCKLINIGNIKWTEEQKKAIWGNRY